MTSFTTCPACNYTRKSSDDAPDWECPKCHKAYIKTSCLVQRQEAESVPESKPSAMGKSSYAGVIVSTLAYWGWESRASGNIRIDLVFIYPLLFYWYMRFLWPRFRWLSILISLLLMALNLFFFTHSYSWFHKSLG
jgi:hypothetical protein